MTQSSFVVFVDLVGYSLLPEQDQMSFFRLFQREAHHVLYDEIVSDECVLIPTGDGLIVGLNNQVESDRLRPLSVIVDISEWATRANRRMRISVHVGDVSIVNDLNRRKNMVGGAVNDGARMLTGAPEGAIILSREYVNRYLAPNRNAKVGNKLPLPSGGSVEIVDEDTIIDKHEERHEVFSVLLANEDATYGNREPISNKYLARIYASDYPKSENLKQHFFRLVANCKNLILVGTYHPNSPAILQNIREPLSERVSVSIHIASVALSGYLQEYFKVPDEYFNSETREDSLRGIRTWLDNRSDQGLIDLQLYEFEDFIPFGASLVDSDVPGQGFIHVSNYLPSVHPRDTPYIETEWRTSAVPPIYDFYLHYIKKLIRGHRRLDL